MRSPLSVLTILWLAFLVACQPSPPLPPENTDGRIAYTRVEENSVALYTMNPDGGEQTRLTEHSGVVLSPKWSRDGKQLAYLLYEPANEAIHIWLAEPGTETEPRLVIPDDVKTIRELSWSADNRYLVYQNMQPNTLRTDVYRVDVTSGEVTNLTADSPVYDSAPQWSPSGDTIVFTSDRLTDPAAAQPSGDRGHDAIWLMNGEGQELINLVPHAAYWENTRPAWSPDGTQIAFYRWTYSADDAPGGPAGLYIINADGSEERQLVDFDLWMYSEPPVWSPDGKLIAFNYGPSEQTDLWIVPAAGGDPVQITNMPGDDRLASWAPDSQSLIFTHLAEDGITLYKVNPDGSQMNTLVQVKGSGFGDWSLK